MSERIDINLIKNLPKIQNVKLKECYVILGETIFDYLYDYIADEVINPNEEEALWKWKLKDKTFIKGSFFKNELRGVELFMAYDCYKVGIISASEKFPLYWQIAKFSEANDLFNKLHEYIFGK